MSFCVYANNGKIKLKYSERRTPFFSEKLDSELNITIFLGEFHSTFEKFKQEDWINNLRRMDDSFAAIRIEKSLKKIVFATSRYGLEPLFYYSKGKKFILSDDFWEIADIVCKSEKSIDRENVIEAANGCYPLFDGTYLKDVFFLEPSIYGEFDFENGLKLEQYYKMHYTADASLDIAKTVDDMDAKIKEAIHKIKMENGDVRYAFGLSGGLDSRLISYYAQELNIQSFIIGDVRPNKIFLSRDHKNARKIAKIYGHKHSECKWNKNIFQYVKHIDLKNNPMGTPQFFKGQKDVEFDVLISGGNGYIVGSVLPEHIEECSVKELATTLRQIGRDFIPKSKKSLHLQKVLKIITGKEINIDSHKEWFNKIYNLNTEKNMLKKLEQFIIDKRGKGESNLDIYEWYFHNILGARNKFGGFESLSGTVRSFSIYNPHLFDFSLKWPFDCLYNRNALKYLIKNKMPKASKIAEQKYEGSIRKKTYGVLYKLFHISMFVLRGNGSEMVNSKFRCVREDFIREMTREGDWFYNIFDIKMKIKEISKFDNKYALLRFWKIKLVLDMLESKEYCKFLATEPFEEI